MLAARLEGRNLALEKLDARRRLTADAVPEVAALYAKLHLSQRRSGREVMQILQRNLVDHVGSRSVHSISKRDVIDVVNAVVYRGSPVAANKSLKVVKSFFKLVRWPSDRGALALRGHPRADGRTSPRPGAHGYGKSRGNHPSGSSTRRPLMERSSRSSP